ncbi:MAG: hypothetical protein ACYDEW_06345 [Vulcanimicrobiaceae bacterium]
MKVAIALLFALFPSDEGMHIGRTGSLFFWLLGNIVRLNLSSEDGFLTGEDWNGTWLYPVRSPEYLTAHHETPDDPRILWAWSGEPRTEPWTWYSTHALLQVDLASPAAATILQVGRVPIPKNSPLYEAQRIMHRQSLPLTLRIRLTTEIVHYWTDQLNEELASEVREHLHPWNMRTITGDAARWIRGERIEPPDESTFAPDVPQPVMPAAKYAWEVDGRPYDFWL